MIAVLFANPMGVYRNIPDLDIWGIDAWGKRRDARRYAGPHPVIAHPPCQRWGRFWGGAPNKPHQYAQGDDDGCFDAALAAVRQWGGVLEHPAHSAAWLAARLPWPPASGGWQRDTDGGWCCHVEQGHYGHVSRKPTWLYAAGPGALPDLRWGRAPQRLPAYAVERYGYAKARRIGVMAAIGGKHKTQLREATPAQFRDVLLSIARSVEN
jgi:hypothetical protein